MPEVSLLGLLPLQSGANNSQSHLQNVSQVHLPHALSTPSSCLLTLSGTPDSHFDTCPLWSITSSPPSSQRSSWSNHFSRSKDLLVSHLLARPSLSLLSSRMLGCLWFLKHPELSRLRTSVHVISSFNTWTRKYQLVTSPFHKLKLEEPFQASGF